MNQELKHAKQTIRNFLRAHYSDERLAMLLAHARDGKLGYSSCCCFVGAVTANHALQRVFRFGGEFGSTGHYEAALLLEGAADAEGAFFYLGVVALGSSLDWLDRVRRRRLIPILRAEMRRRERERAGIQTPELAEVR